MKQSSTLETTSNQPVLQDSIDRETLNLLASWRLQDATEDQEEIRAAERELTQFKKAMNDARTIVGEPHLYP